jgi:hypothetical protein
MGYYVKSAIGLALFVGSIVLFNVKLIALLETGTCASGNTPYEIARPCPEGTGTDMWLLVGSIFGALIGLAVLAFRGRSPRAADGGGLVASIGGGLAAWGVFFTGTGATMLIYSLSSETIPPDGELGGTIVGITFLLMGLPALAMLAWGVLKRRAGPGSPAGSRRARSGPRSGR